MLPYLYSPFILLKINLRYRMFLVQPRYISLYGEKGLFEFTGIMNAVLVVYSWLNWFMWFNHHFRKWNKKCTFQYKSKYCKENNQFLFFSFYEFFFSNWNARNFYIHWNRNSFLFHQTGMFLSRLCLSFDEV